MRIRPAPALVLVGAVCLFILPWPLSRLSEGLPDSAVDPLSFVWILERMSQNLFDGARALYDGKILFPFTESLATSETLPAAAVLYGGIRLLLPNPLLSFNVLQLLFLVANYGSMYFFAREFLGRLGATVCALVFGFSLVRLAHLQHFHLMPQFFFPLFWWCAWRFERTRRARFLAAMGALLGTQLYFSLSLGIVLFLSALPYAGFVVWRMVKDRGSWKPVFGGMVAFLVVSAPIGLSYARISQEYGFRRPISDAYGSSANLGSWFLVTSDHLYDPLLGDNILGGNGGRGREENVLFVGFAVLFLSYMGWRRIAKCRSAPGKRISRLLLYSLLFSVVLAFGTNLGLYNLLYYTVPGLKGFRTPARMGLSYLFFMATLAGIGAQSLWFAHRREPRKLAVGATLLIALFLLDTWRPLTYPRVADTLSGVSQTLRQRSDGLAVIHLPFEDHRREALRMYESLFHGHPIANGYTGFKPPTYGWVKEQVAVLLEGDGAARSRLREKGFGYLAVDKDSPIASEPALSGLALAHEDRHAFLFLLP